MRSGLYQLGIKNFESYNIESDLKLVVDNGGKCLWVKVENRCECEAYLGTWLSAKCWTMGQR